MKCGDCYWYKKKCKYYPADMNACPCYCEASNIQHKELSGTEKTIIREYAGQDMNLTATAKKLNYHRNTIVYHLDSISRKTFLDPRAFYDLVKLLRMIGDET